MVLSFGGVLIKHTTYFSLVLAPPKLLHRARHGKDKQDNRIQKLHIRTPFFGSDCDRNCGPPYILLKIYRVLID